MAIDTPAVVELDLLFGKVNTEEQQELSAYFHIRSIPTLMIFRDNIVVFAQPGALSAAALDEVLAATPALDMEAVRGDISAQESGH